MIKLYKKHLKGAAVFTAVLAPLAMFIEVLLGLQQPAMMSKIIDIGVANGDLNYVFYMGIKMIFIAFVTVLAGMLCSVLSSYTAVKAGAAS